MSHVIEAMTWFALGLMVANWEWERWGRHARRAVAGSLHRAEALRRRRIWRWPGFMFWPVVLPGWLSHLSESLADPSWVLGFWALASLAGGHGAYTDWKKLRRELEEDEDDWLNRGKRKLRELLAAASPLPSPA